jgi:hypothetical protein
MRGSGKLANKNYYIEAFFVKQKYISVIIIMKRKETKTYEGTELIPRVCLRQSISRR